jgi:hypothetical protein
MTTCQNCGEEIERITYRGETYWTHCGAYFYCWNPKSHTGLIFDERGITCVAEPVEVPMNDRDLMELIETLNDELNPVAR